MLSGKEERLYFDSSKATSDIIEWLKNRYSKKIEKLRPVLNDYINKLVIINNFEELDEVIRKINEAR